MRSINYEEQEGTEDRGRDRGRHKDRREGMARTGLAPRVRDRTKLPECRTVLRQLLLLQLESLGDELQHFPFVLFFSTNTAIPGT